MTAEIRIRHALPDDAGAIHAMLAAMAEELGFGARFASTEATIRSHGFGPQARFSTLIAEAGEPVGLALYFAHFSTTRGQPGAYVQDLWTAPLWRGRGLGASLLSAVAAASARDWGAAYLALSVHGHNAAAARFYAGLGFDGAPDELTMTLSGPRLAALAAAREVTA